MKSVRLRGAVMRSYGNLFVLRVVNNGSLSYKSSGSFGLVVRIKIYRMGPFECGVFIKIRLAH